MATEVLFRLNIDTSGGKASFEELKRGIAGLERQSKIGVGFKNVSELKSELAQLEKVRDNAFDFKTAQQAQREVTKVQREIDKLNKDLDTTSKNSDRAGSGLKNIFQFAAGNLIAQGVGGFFGGVVDKAREADNAADSLTVGLSKAGLTGSALTAELARISPVSRKIADDFALPVSKVQELQGKLAGFGNLQGDLLDKVTEFSIGAANALQLPAESVGRLIARSADPEQLALLSKYGIVFEKNATATERFAVLQAKLGPAVDATKKSTQDAVGNFDRLKNKIEEAGLSAATGVFDAIAPALEEAAPLIDVFVAGIAEAGKILGGTIKFAADNKTAIIALAAAYALFKAQSKIGELGGLSKIFADGKTKALEYGKSISEKLVPGIIAKTKAEQAGAAASSGLAKGIKGIGAAIAANPIGLILTGITTAITLFDVFSGSTKDAEEAIGGLNKSADGFAAANKKLGEVRETANNTKKLADEYDNLSQKENKSAAEKALLKTITTDLDKATGGAATEWDAYGNVIGVATNKVRSMSDAQIKLAQDVRKTNFSSFMAQLNGAFASLNKGVNEFNDLQKESAEGGGTLTKIWAGITQDGKKIADALNENSVEAGEVSARNQELIQSIAEGLATSTDRATVKFDFILQKVGKKKELADQIWVAYQNQLKTLGEQAALAKKSETEKKKDEEAITEIIKRRADEAAKALEIELRLDALKKGQKFSEENALAVAEKRLEVLQKGARDSAGAIAKLPEKVRTEFDLGIKESDIKRLEAQQAVTLKVKAEADAAAKFQLDLQDLADKATEQEISLGIRPKEDSLTLIRSKIDDLKDSIAADKLELKFDDAGELAGVEARNAAKEIAQFQQEIVRLEAEGAKARIDLDRTLKLAKIANIDDLRAKEKEELLAKQQEELDQFLIRERSGIALTERELALKREIEVRHRREISALDEKFAREDAEKRFDIIKTSLDEISAIRKGAVTFDKILSKDEADAKRADFQKQETDERTKLARGEISQAEFSRNMKKLAKDRSQFEQEQSGFSFQALAAGAKNAYGKALESAANYFDGLFQQYVVNAALHSIMEGQVTAGTAAGAAARQALNSGEASSNLIVAESSVLKGATETAASAIASLGWFGIPVAIAASLAFTFAMSKLAKLIAFEKGGVLVGEKGPEIIASKRDFAQFATQLTLMANRTLERKLGERRTTESGAGGLTGGASPIRVKVSGTISGRGRTMKSVIDSDSLNRRSEVLGVRR